MEIVEGKMGWYAAHMITYQKYKNGIQDRYPVSEEIVLLEADSLDEAFIKSREIGDDEEYEVYAVPDSIKWSHIDNINEREDFNGDVEALLKNIFKDSNERIVEYIFAGVRKVIKCENQKERLVHGSEISHSEYLVKTEDDLKKLLKSEKMVIKYIE